MTEGTRFTLTLPFGSYGSIDSFQAETTRRRNSCRKAKSWNIITIRLIFTQGQKEIPLSNVECYLKKMYQS